MSAQHGVPKAVVDVGEFGENVYDAVTAGNWAKATSLAASLETAARSLKPAEHAQLTGVLDSLHRAVAAKDRNAARETANRVTLLAARISEPYHPPVPVAVVLLDYYGRELEIWGARGDVAKSRLVADSLRATWDGVRAAVVAAGGSSAAHKTDGLVKRIEQTRSAKGYAALSKPFLDVVDELEKPFEKPAKKR